MRRRKSIRNIFLALLLIFSVFFGSPELYADTITNYFDGLLANNEYVLYTDIEISNDGSLQYMLSQSLNGSAYSEYWNSWQDYSQLSLAPTTCSYSSHTCNIELVRYTYSTREVIKEYQNVNIIIDSNISSYFPMFSGDNMIINYDESMFSSDEEKQNYILSYVNSFQVSDGYQYTAYSYKPYDSAPSYAVFRNDDNNGRMMRRMIKKVAGVVFDYVEEPYSADFQKLTSGTLTVKTDADIDSDILSAYIWRKTSGVYSFNLDGPIKNNKAYIKMTKYENGHENLLEKHLVTIVKDSNIDLATFERFGFGEYVDIKADTPSDMLGYLTNFFNMAQYNVNYDDRHENIFGTSGYNSGDLGYATITYSNSYTNGVTDVQIHRAPIRFVGYKNTKSKEYASIVGDKIIVRGDKLDSDTIREYIQNINSGDYSMHMLGCNDNYAQCDVALVNWRTQEFEIHKVNIELDNSISDEFKAAISINSNDTIDIIADRNDMSWDESVSGYNEEAGSYIQIYCGSGNTCRVSLTNYRNKTSEIHEFRYNVIASGRTSNYSSLIKPEITVYPGENYSWSSFPTTMLSNNNTYLSTRCGNNYKCSVAILNADKKIEIHDSNVTVKNGKSPEYKAAFPTDSLYLNAVSGDDYIISLASQAYLLSKTKTYSYLEDYSNNRAKIVYNGYEKHTVDVTLAREKQGAREKINQAIAKIGRQNFNFIIDDLEYVNLFYYKEPSLWGLGNFNSKSINDTFSRIVNDKHIGYYFVEQGGMGDRFMEEAGGGILLYYDGVAYDDANAGVTTNINRVIYIPDDTANNPQSFVVAAQKRIDQYLGRNNGVVVSYAGRLEDNETSGLDQYMDMAGFDGNYYKLSYKDKVEDVLIMKNSSRMQRATFVASDVNNNITVKSRNANYPTNTVVSAENIDENDDSYKALMKKLGLKKAQVVDIDLYSPTAGDIKNFDGVEFDVSVPIDENKVEGDKIYAYYVSDDGKIEEHPVEKDDFMGKFGVTHFSTYIISGKIDDSIIEKANNPKTYDDISLWVTLFSASMISLVGIAGLAIRKKNINRTK